MQTKTSFFKKGMAAALLWLAFGFVLAGCPLSEDSTTYTISYSPGEGDGTAPASQKVEEGTTINLPSGEGMTAPAGAEKTFAGWKTGNQTYAAGTSFTVNADTVFTAIWKAPNYTVSYATGGGSGTAPANETVEAGTTITLPPQGGMTAPEGKTFAGWKAGDQTYAAGTSFTVSANTTLTAQWDDESGDPDNVYEGFYSYPTGRVDQNGLLTVKTSINENTLLFNGTVEKGNYLGTISPMSEVKLKLPEEKFYTIVAVEKKNYEERKEQAAQFNVLTYYSNTQGYTVTVTPSNTYGNGTWVFNNNTTYWVQIKKADLSQNYAVIAPNALRVLIPVAMNTPYDYFVYFSKELKYNGKVVALVETTDRSQANTAQVNDARPVYTTTINPVNVPTSIKPAVMVKNNSNKSVRVYYAGQQKTNGAVGGDLVIVGSESQLISGFDPNDNTNTIEFNANAWEQNKRVPVNMVMAADKVYEIVIPNDEEASGITVTEKNASEYYN